MTVLAETNMEALEAGLAQARSLARVYAYGVREQFGERCRRVTLFGSAARGDWTFESDIDVLVLLDAVSSEDRQWLCNYAYDVGLDGAGLLLQPIPLSEDRFDELRMRERLFARDIEWEGVEL